MPRQVVLECAGRKLYLTYLEEDGPGWFGKRADGSGDVLKVSAWFAEALHTTLLAYGWKEVPAPRDFQGQH